MSFSANVKKELALLPIGTPEENQAELYGTLLFSKCFINGKYLFASEIKQVVDKVSIYLYGTHENKIKNDNLTYYLPFDKSLSSGHLMIQLKKLIVSSNNNSLLPCILRGAFLSCGNITNPKSAYRLEFSIKDKVASEFLIDLLKKVDVVTLNPKIIVRKSNICIYIKDNSQIIDFLTYIGATNSSMQFIQVKMMKEVRNYVNRMTNFETANITKTTFAASEQIQKINKLINSNVWNTLPEYLRETALLRVKNPYLSLDELSKLFTQPITKSGVNYRLKKIIEYF